MKTTKPRDGFCNIPNSLTVFRIVLVPVMVVLLWDDPSQEELRVAWIIFVGAMLTDIVDGWLARRWGLTSPAGAYLDPLADKLMVTTTLVMMCELGWVAGWLVALLICRELAITGLRGIASQEGMILKAGTMGKAKTSYQGAAIGFFLWGWDPLGTQLHLTGLVLLYFATFFSLASGAEYIVSFFKQGATKIKRDD